MGKIEDKDIDLHIDRETLLQEYMPKAEYENRLKADMVAMLEEIELELDEVGPSSCDICIGNEYQNLIQQKINKLKGEK